MCNHRLPNDFFSRQKDHETWLSNVKFVIGHTTLCLLNPGMVMAAAYTKRVCSVGKNVDLMEIYSFLQSLTFPYL